ncbi:MAG: hypothetical protein OXG56_05660 [Gammaproteobacteria bacterium]|nr:hypothetical protein [Gammaproteobacteria bacterium]
MNTISRKGNPAHPFIRLSEMDLASFISSPFDQTGFIDLSHLSLLRVSGEDAETFLQGQFSNDTDSLPDGKAQIHAYCTPKGRAFATLQLLRNRNGFWVLLPADLAGPFMKRLKMFVMRAKVEIETDPDHFAWGVTGMEDLSGVPSTVPGMQSVFEYSPRRHLVVSTRPIMTAPETGNVKTYHGDLWRWLDIREGIPQVYATTSESFIPQNINLDLIDGISFKKGCYPGQEIIARIRYLGKPKHRMISGRVESGEPVREGTAIYLPERPGQKAGSVVDSVQTGIHCYEVSAMVPVVAVSDGRLSIHSASGPPLRRLSLPYAIP